MLLSLVSGYQRFGGTYLSIFRVEIYDIIIQKTVTQIFITVKTSDVVYFNVLFAESK
jgi:hypothetical protein